MKAFFSSLKSEVADIASTAAAKRSTDWFDHIDVFTNSTVVIQRSIRSVQSHLPNARLGE
jgi:hypothetical protein